ncbi:hypothetical protein PanWU01x14_010300 [Parasponia andersonii]|uniref:Uncharacterized protein n=1 Tax=Parasponia andersonii TaxID=3476 RepID=A0A2P5E2P0_PARAD|nr:hypothetical protein PanWU01x14_010300 [Parasponia andersonii]
MDGYKVTPIAVGEGIAGAGLWVGIDGDHGSGGNMNRSHWCKFEVSKLSCRRRPPYLSCFRF